MQEINNYFNGLTFKKSQIYEGYTTYIAMVKTYDTFGDKYVILYVMNKDANFEEEVYNKIKWFGINTTNLGTSTRLKMQPFYRSPKESISLNKTYLISTRDYDRSVYIHTLDKNIRLTLLHNTSLNSTLQFPDTTSLHLAVNTFKCIIKKEMI